MSDYGHLLCAHEALKAEHEALKQAHEALKASLKPKPELPTGRGIDVVSDPA